MLVQWEAIPEGDLGTSATLARIRQLVNQAIRDPSVVQAARRITAGARDDGARVQALVAWVRQHYRFVKDPTTYELLTAPRQALEDIAQDGYVHGDCDDAVTLAAALAEAVGIETRFRVLAPDQGPESERLGYSHVLIEFWTPAGWVPVDFTLPEDAAIPTGERGAVATGGTLMRYYMQPRRLSYYGTLGQAPPAEVPWWEAVIGGVTETTKAVLPVLERYGVLTPEAGQYPYRLPFPGEPVSLYGTTGYFRPGEGPAAWAPLLLLGGGALLLFLFAGRRRSR